MDEAKKYWDDVYEGNQATWLGRANVALPKYVGEPVSEANAKALDLGCSTGGDSVWLAKNGWNVTAVDVSGVALDRAKVRAKENNVEDKIEFKFMDLSSEFPSGHFDLVSALFLHSPVGLQREQTLRKAADAVVDKGHFLIVGHASPLPWSTHPHKTFPTAEETYNSMELDESNWEVITLGTFDREATGPDEQVVTVKDSVIYLKRLSV